MKKIALISILGAILFGVNWYWFVTSVVPLDSGHFLLKQGENLATIESRLLRDNKAFFPHLLYKLYVSLINPVIKPGDHQFKSDATVSEVLLGLENEPGPVRIRLPEGDRASTYAHILAESGIATEQDLLQCFKSCELTDFEHFFSSVSGFEGYLFPDTYIFTPGTPSKEVLSSLLGNFSRRIRDLEKKYQSFILLKGLRHIVIMASLLEREGRGLEEKRIIAGILYKRLALNMRLDVDATVLYIVGNWKANLTVSDLNFNSPYNTRKFTGLPPGPIANPSLESLEAAMSPISTNYLYYLTGKDSNMHYAATLEEHAQNKRLFL